MNAGCAGKTVRSLENVCHTSCVHDKVLYKSTFTVTLPRLVKLNVIIIIIIIIIIHTFLYRRKAVTSEAVNILLFNTS